MENNRIAILSGLFLFGAVMAFLIVPIAFSADTIILSTRDGSNPVSCLQGSELILAQNLTDLCDVVIISPMNNELLQYNGSYWVNAVVSTSDDTVCANVGTGAQVFKDGECNFRTIVGSSDISVVQNLNEIVIDYNGTAGGDTTVCTNVGAGTGLICSGGNVDIKSLIAGSGITISNNADDITITNASPDNTSCVNLGGGLGVYKSGECSFNSLIAGTGITITDTTDDLTFASQCASTGSGEPVCESSNNINSLIAGNGIDITDTTGDLTISSETRYITKPSDETVNNSAVLQNDNDLLFSVDANAIYIVKMQVRIDIKASSDFKYALTVPAGAIARAANIYTMPNGAISGGEVDVTAARIATVTSDSIHFMGSEFMVITGGTSGTVNFQWAQNTAQANNTIIYTGSTFIVTKVV